MPSAGALHVTARRTWTLCFRDPHTPGDCAPGEDDRLVEQVCTQQQPNAGDVCLQKSRIAEPSLEPSRSVVTGH